MATLDRSLSKRRLSFMFQLMLLILVSFNSPLLGIEYQKRTFGSLESSFPCEMHGTAEKRENYNSNSLHYYGYYYVDDWDWHHQQEVENGDGKWVRITSLEPGTPEGGWDDDLYAISHFTNLIQVHWRSKPNFIKDLVFIDTLQILLQLDYRCVRTAFGNCSELEGFEWHQSKEGSIDWARYQLERFLTVFDPNRTRANRIFALYIADEPSGHEINSNELDRWAKSVKTIISELYSGHLFKTMVVFSSSYDYNPLIHGSHGSGQGPYFYNDNVPQSVDIITIEPYPELFGSISQDYMNQFKNIGEKMEYLNQLILYAAHVAYNWAESIAKGRPIILQGQAYDHRYWWDVEQYQKELFDDSHSLTNFSQTQMLYANNFWTYYWIALENSVGAVYHFPKKKFDTNTIGLLWFYYPLSRDGFHPEDSKMDIWTTHCQIGNQILYNGTSACPPPRLNHPPTISILLPSNGSSYIENETITFIGLGIDQDGDTLDYSWTSSIDGEFGDFSKVYINNLSVGNHTITLITDDGKVRNKTSILVEIVGSMRSKRTESTSSFVSTITQDSVTTLLEFKQLFMLFNILTSVLTIPVFFMKRKKPK